MKLTIVGASGHGRVIADIAKLNGYKQIEFLDDNEKLTHCGKYPVVGKTENAFSTKNDVFVGIGNSLIRKRFIEQIDDELLVTLIHPDSVIADDVIIGKGSVVMAGTVINSGVKIGKGVIINTCASVDHDCRIGNFVHVSVGAHIAGTVNVNDNTWIGIGATVSNNLSITSDCMIGAGAVVINNIIKKGTYVGVPVRLIKYE